MARQQPITDGNAPRGVPWNSFVYYGEVVGFALAWVAVFVAASHFATRPVAGPSPEQIAAAGTTLNSELDR